MAEPKVGKNDGPCKIEGCEKPAHCRGWCPMHYWRWQQYGDPHALLGRFSPVETLADLLAKCREEPCPRPELGPCLVWTGATVYGYGRLKFRSRTVLAHRLAYEFTHGLLLPGLDLCHRCDVPACCRPSHLKAGTRHENVGDMIRRHGHPARRA